MAPMHTLPRLRSSWPQLPLMNLVPVCFLACFISDFVFSFSLLALFVHIAQQKLSLGWSWPVWMPPCGHPMLPT